MFIHSMFSEAASSHPEKIALRMGERTLTYKELDELSNRIARKLIEDEVKPGDIVGICLKRSQELVASVLGILKAGAAYLPLDPDYPLDRLKYMISHSQVKIILGDQETEYFLSDLKAKCLLLKDNELSRLPGDLLSVDETRINLCYVIYTSGSTGQPKGVCLGHKALVNLILWQNEQTRIKEDLKTLQFTPLSFDVHFQEFFSTLTTGGELILITEETRLNPVKLLKTIETHKVGRIFLPFVALNQLAETASQIKIFPKTLKEVTTAGEQLKVTPAIVSFFKNLNDAFLYNHYGPSESHVVTSLTLEGDPQSWPALPPIGKALTHCEVHLLNDSLQKVEQGEEGDLYLGGICLADGYLHAPELTQEKFLHHPQLGRIYKTGDIGLEKTDGNIQFLGRKDGQVKIRGYRIETGEVEVALQKCPGVLTAAVKVIELHGEKSLSAYVTGSFSLIEMKKSLRNYLPDYMLPSYFTKLESLPLTPSGKVNYSSLPLPSRERPDLISEFTPAQNETQECITQCWKKHLYLDEIGILDNFFDLGGNSLLAIRIMVELNQTFQQDLSVVSFFEAPTIKQLALAFEGHGKQDEIISSPKSLGGDIAVIGATGRFPGAKSVEEFWENLKQNKVTLQTFDPKETDASIAEKLKKDKSYIFISGEYPGQRSFDYKYFGMTPREAELTDPQQRKFLELSVEALEAAGYYTDSHKEVIGIFAGMGNSKYSRLVDQHPEKIAVAGEFNVMLGLEKDYIATRVAHKLNLTGPALSIHTGCSTSLVAIIEAVKSIRAGDCTMALAGGISISGTPKSGHLFLEGGILSKDGRCSPFDAEATGTVFTEGGGVVVLKRLDSAIEDGDNILGVIKGIGINNDGSDKMSFTAPSVKGQAEAIRRAQQDAGIDPRSLCYIEAHGTATPVGDPIEVESLRQVFQKQTHDKNFCYLGSVKANIGHLTAAAGVAGFLKALFVTKEGILPGLPHFQNENKLLRLSDSPFKISSETIELEKSSSPRRVGVSSFGVGGTNAHIVLEEYRPAIVEAVENADETPTLFKISSKSKEQLEVMEQNLRSHLAEIHPSEWRKSAFTLDKGRKDFPYRKILVAKNKTDTEKAFTFHQFTKALPLFMLFPGQGSQYIKMGKDLSRTSAIFKFEMDRALEIYKRLTGINLEEVLFHDSHSENLNNTFYTQPALFIIEYALGKTLLEMGYKPKALIGHSIGEYAAATLSGIFSLEDGLKIIGKRAELMRNLPRGSMLSVALSEEEILSKLQGYELDIAAINAKNSIVVAGEEKEIERFKNDLETQSIGSVLLKTSHAFHSRMMKPAVEEFKKLIEEMEKKPAKIPLLSTVDSTLKDEELLRSDYWAQHIVKSVRFAPTIEKVLSETPEAIMVEIGPGNVLSNLVRKLNHGKAHLYPTLGIKADQESETLLKAIGGLWLTGHEMKEKRLLYKKGEQKRVYVPVSPFEQNEVWINKPLMEQNMSNDKRLEFSKKLIDIFEKSSGIDVGSMGKEVTFLEMGMDSLFLTQMALQLKKELKIEVTFRQLLEEYSSIEALVEKFSDKVTIDLPAPQKMQEIPVQTQIQQKTIRPNIAGSGLEQIVQQQLELMREQMLLLQGGRSEVVTEVQEIKKTVTRGADIKTAKDSFGAAPKINVEKSLKFNTEQSAAIKTLFENYSQKTKASKEFTQKYRRTHADPRVVSGFKPENKEIIYPVVVKRSQDQYLWDLDGNKYIDMTCGFGSNFFGNGNELIKKLTMKQLEEGIEIGPQHPLVGEVSELVCELTGNDRAAFCNTGSEAVLGAMRLARTITGREKIVVFSGSYHGINDEVIIRTARQKPYPAAPGINETAVSNMIVLDYGTDESLRIIKEMAHELAAVMVEPVQSRRCNFHPKDFLKELRKITSESQSCFIFDEVITGFRVHPAGAQGYFGIKADLCTYGKIVGGGMPIGVISGKAEYMDALDGGFWQFGDDSTPTVGVTYFAGTFVRHPLALAAAKGALSIIKEGGVKQLTDLNLRAQKFAEEINQFCHERKVPLEMHNFGSLMKPKWMNDVLGGELLFALLRLKGVHVYDGFPWFLNLAHKEEDIQFVTEAIKKSVEDLQQMGLLPDSLQIEAKKTIFDLNHPPRPGARLGQDEKGNPAWFMEDQNRPGEYFLIEG